jgi:catechol 2,3-dioxygenase-like lactoylglutathione lyase family enzyme
MQARRILETCLYVDNLDTAAAFYQHVMGLELYSRVAGRHAFFRCGENMFLLFNAETTRQAVGDVPTHGATGAGHVAFAIGAEEVVAWRSHLQNRGVVIEKEVDWPGGGQSLYFRDPSGNCIEVATPIVWQPREESDLTGSA